jgi:uncharacterized membrane protein
MESRTKVAGHAIHPILVVFPLGLLATSFIFDLIRMAQGSGDFGIASFYMITAGVVGGLAAAVFGFVDWLAIPPGTRARRVGAVHGVANVLVVGLFVLSWIARVEDPAAPADVAFVFSLVGVLLALFSGWLGGELVERLGVGVDDGANVNAPSSLSRRPAAEH